MSSSAPSRAVDTSRAERAKRGLWRVLNTLARGNADRLYGTTRRWYRIATRGWKTTLNSELDLGRYLRHSFVLTDPVSTDHMAAFLRMRYHTFEKGLSLPEPRPRLRPAGARGAPTGARPLRAADRL